MNKVKLKERLENAVEAFFDNENLEENSQLELYKTSAILTNESFEPSTISNDVLNIKLLKQLFLFLPSAFILFLGSGGLTWRLLLPASEGLERFSLFNLGFLLLAAILTILGLGNLRNIKHLSIPLSIVALGVILGILNSFFDGVGSFIPYLFPVAFIVPVLVKNWLDSEEI